MKRYQTPDVKVLLVDREMKTDILSVSAQSAVNAPKTVAWNDFIL